MSIAFVVCTIDNSLVSFDVSNLGTALEERSRTRDRLRRLNNGY